MTKQEILEKAHPDKSYTTPPLANYATVYKAMDEYYNEAIDDAARLIKSELMAELDSTHLISQLQQLKKQ